MNRGGFAAVELRVLSAVITKTGHQALAERFKAQGITMGHLQFGVLRMVCKEPKVLTDLSRNFGLSPSTLVPTIDSLEERGLVVRERDQADRRRVLIHITEAGRDTLDMTMAVSENDPLHQALSNLGAERTGQLLDMLRDLVNSLPDGPETLAQIEARLQVYRQHLDTNTE